MAHHDYSVGFDESTAASLSATAGSLLAQDVIDHLPELGQAVDLSLLEQVGAHSEEPTDR